MPFVIGRLSSGQTALDATRLQIVRDAQTLADTAMPFVGTVDTDTFALKTDNLHFDADGQQSLGSAFAYMLLYLNQQKGTLIMLQ